MASHASRLLIKARPATPGAAFAVGKIPLNLQPLFPGAPRTAALAAAAPPEWHTADLPTDIEDADLWDLCYKLNTHGFGVAGSPDVEFAEPDLVQQWRYDSNDRLAARAFAAATTDPCKAPANPNASYAIPPGNPFDWRWYQSNDFSGLDAARSQVSNPASRITIAHLDTGYREGHSVLPQFLDLARQRNFIDKDRPNDARDLFVDGILDNAGHGTGTLSILAGSSFNGAPFGAPSGVVGGAPFATVIPVRVANSVVLFTNSSIAQGLDYAINQQVDVLSMSMGGVASRLWADMVNKAYEAGLTLVTAAGNNFGPGVVRIPRFIVYPARFRRVLAACGVMANGKPYADFLDPRLMGASYGPDSKMDTAIAAYTPNVPWAKYGCTGIIDFDGQGTSAATPQVAAAAACWLQKNKGNLQYSHPWMRVEAVRRALFSTANSTNREHFGRGAMRAHLAMDTAPAKEADLRMEQADSIAVPILGPVFHDIFGAARPTAQEMLHLEAAQLISRDGELQRLLIEAGVDPDQPPDSLPDGFRASFLEAMAESSSASDTLKAVVQGQVRKARPAVVPGSPARSSPVAAENFTVPAPISRRLRVFAFDPILGTRVDTESINETTVEVPWEASLQPGPVGEYLEVVDVDPASGSAYAPVDLNNPHLLASDGLDPAEGVPQFHQQMVYAVAMSTIGHFEDALGRTALRAPAITRKNGEVRSAYVQRLRIYPHALREQNAYYSPDKKALLLGYFNANMEDAGGNLPGGIVFTCLSHDVIAHETTHALLDGLHRHYQYQTNADIAAFHEAFADIVALFQHFTIPVALRKTIAESRGDLSQNNLLADLAQQFGQASNGSRALRSALGRPPKSTDYSDATEAHDRGAVLLAAIFQAFLEIYEARVADLRRLATGGTGILPPGAIPEVLVDRLSREAAITAKRVLRTCIRALDYCPPVDLTFGDYLRALITADMDLDPEDALNYRTAYISGFRARGIFPRDVRTLSEKNLRWQPPKTHIPHEHVHKMLSSLDLSWNLSTSRQRSYLNGEHNGFLLWQWLQKYLSDETASALEADLGVFIRPGPNVPPGVPLNKDGIPVLLINSVRPARRVNNRGQQSTDLVIEAIQRFIVKDPETGEETTHRGGCTVLIDLDKEEFRYVIRKRVDSPTRVAAEKQFMKMAAGTGQAYFTSTENREPFALLHRGV